VPPGATAVGVPARIVGESRASLPIDPSPAAPV
jgi:serine acetyltransferase